MGILCQTCETTFAPLDAYGVRFFRDEQFDLAADPALDGFLFADGVDLQVLKRFLIFVAWRIGASEKSWFGSVDLGTQLEALRQLVLQTETIPPDKFPTVLKRYRGSASLVGPHGLELLRAQDAQLNPCRRKWGDRDILQFYLGAYVVNMAVDDVHANGFWEMCAIGSAQSLLITDRYYATSPELRFIKQRFGSARTAP